MCDSRLRNPCLSIAEAAAYTSLSLTTMRRFATECGAGDGPPVVRLTDGPKGRRGFRLSDLNEFLDQRTRRG